MPSLITRFLRSIIQRFSPKTKPTKKIQQWDFIMVFDISQKQQIIQYFSQIQCLKTQQHVRINFIQYKQNHKLLVLLSMDEYVTIEQAHQLKILKIKNKKSFSFTLSQLNNMILVSDSSNSKHYTDYLLFIRARFQKTNKRVAEQQKYSVFNKYKIEKYPRDRNDELFTPEEQLRCKYNFLLTYNQTIKKQKQQTKIVDSFRFPFVDIMKHSKYKFEQLIPIHKNSRFSPIIFDSVKSYIGSNQETYFQFVEFLQKWLIFPAFIGLLTTLFNYFFQYTADDSPGDFVYSFLIMFWSIYFITHWQNQSKWLKVKEISGYNDQLWSEHQNIIVKDGLSKRISHITGKVQYFLPLREKLYFYFVSIGTCLLLVFGSIIFMILSLNARGFVDPTHKLLYFETISSWASHGGIFDANTWYGQIPNLFHVIFTNLFDEQFYRPLAKKLTLFQRHLNSKTHSNSIIIKYFVYEFIITFADFFYIAFVRFDIQGLRQQLLSLFFIDIVRRLVAETLLPLMKKKYFKQVLKMKEKEEEEKHGQDLKRQVIMEVNKEHFQSFDDYLQIVTNFSYLVLISSCFPLAPLLIVIAHSIQIFQDKYKLIHIYRRKLPQKFVGMSYWKQIIIFICYMSILTNILLFAFSSQQIVSLFPQVFESGKDLVLGNTDFTQVMGDTATTIFSALLAVGNSTLETITAPIDYLVSDNNSTSIMFGLSNNQTEFNGWSSVSNNGQDCANSPHNFLFQQQHSSFQPFSLTSFTPVPKQHQVQFLAILFILEHIFLLGFIILRKYLSKRKNIADIFFQRRAYKRNIKKYLSKDILNQNLRDQMVKKLFSNMKLQQNNKNQDENNDKFIQNSLVKLISSTSTTDQTMESSKSIQQNDQTQDIFTSLIAKIAEKAQLLIDSQKNSHENQIDRSSIKVQDKDKKTK